MLIKSHFKRSSRIRSSAARCAHHYEKFVDSLIRTHRNANCVVDSTSGVLPDMRPKRLLRHKCRESQEAVLRTKVEGLFPREPRVSHRHGECGRLTSFHIFILRHNVAAAS